MAGRPEASAGHLSRDCDGFGRGLTLPRHGDGLDISGLVECAKKLRAKNRAFAKEGLFQLETDGQVWVQDTVGVVEALRRGTDAGLFDDVVLRSGS